jgi:SAM-dependent methyltransferase
MTSLEREAAATPGQECFGDQLPPYAPMLAAFQRAHAAELRQMIADLPLRPGDRVLDLACGEGVYAAWLAERVAPGGSVNGVDISSAFLALAQQRAAASPHADLLAFQSGSIDALPFNDDTFDLVWCAQSMYSLPDPVAALRELRRVTRPGGTVAIFENDTLHQLVLPWPAELELAVRAAQVRSLNATNPTSAKFFIGRDMCKAFAAADLPGCTVTPYTTVRHAPLGADEASFLRWYLEDIGSRARQHLADDARALWDQLLDPHSGHGLLEREDLYVIYINLLAQAVKPSTR